MTRAEQPTADATAPDDHLVADSRERALRALLRQPQLKRLWSAHIIAGTGDILALLVLVVLVLQAAVADGSFGGDYRGAAFAVAAVFAARILATLLFGAVLLGPLSALTAPGGPLDRRWTLFGADGLRAVLLIIAPLWIDWVPQDAPALLLVTAFVTGVAERFWTVCRESVAPSLLPAPPLEGAAVRPLPDHMDALRRLSLRTGFLTLPTAGAALVAVTLISNLLATGVVWFDGHQAALASYVAAGLFAASLSVLASLELPAVDTPRPKSPIEGLRRPRTAAGVDRGRTGAVPLLVFACAAVAAAISAAVAVAVLHAIDLDGGPVTFGLLALALTGGTALGIRTAPSVLPFLSRRRLMALATALTGIALLAAGLVPDVATVLGIVTVAGFTAGIAANTGHTLLNQETEPARQARTTAHLHAVVRVFVAVAAVAAPVLAGAIGRHRVESGKFVFAHGGAAYTLMLVGALLLPVAALLLAKVDDRSGVSLRHDLRDAVRGADPVEAQAATGFFIVVEGGDGAGKTTQAEVLAEWVRAKGHEVVLTREPGATPMGKRLRSILLDVQSAGISHRAEALLYAADRAEHVDTVVRPALERGAVVISDRYIDSSVAYQGAGRDLSPTEVARISRWATGGLVPHLTVLLDVAPEAARERFTEAPDRLESEPAEFHARVRSGFLTLAAADPGRYLVVDASQESDAVTMVIRRRLDAMLPLSDAEKKAQEEARKAAEEEARRRAEEEAARRAEEERVERERQAALAAEEARRQQELAEARDREAERQAEEAKKRAEDARRRAEEERARMLAAEQERAAEEARRRQQAEDEARVRAAEEARRQEEQRRAEEALLRAEHERAERERAEHESGGPAAGGSTEAGSGEQGPGGGSGSGSAGSPGEGSSGAGGSEGSASADPWRGGGPGAGGAARASGGRPYESPDVVETVPTPVVRPSEFGPDDTAVLPKIDDSGAPDETAVLPPVRDDHPGDVPPAPPGGPADRVPPGYFRDDHAAPPPGQSGSIGPTDETRPIPQVDADAARRRPRPDWAEETPLDDLPTLADELLGPHDDEDGRGGSGGHGRGR
ncbi:dTMP kinase [Streptomyces odontomachi]|uniref:dTMP kinase n=1 Tax=Streptomyces odontomachi TaxID=2944940 RepID=UPI00210EA115|nr:dTMP kinase [Streptomyces sp. ODS25]